MVTEPDQQQPASQAKVKGSGGQTPQPGFYVFVGQRFYTESDPKSSRHNMNLAVNFSGTQLLEAIRKYICWVCRILVLQLCTLVSFALFCII